MLITARVTNQKIFDINKAAGPLGCGFVVFMGLRIFNYVALTRNRFENYSGYHSA
jgi:hypothetical protein